MKTTRDRDRLVTDYLEGLTRAARVLPRSERDDLLYEIRAHIDSELRPGMSETEVRNILDRLGRPETIVAAARPDDAATVRRGAREVFALFLLVTGFPLFVGWFAGAGLLLWSPLWTGRQKVLGLLVWPGGFGTVLLAMLLTARGVTSTNAGAGVNAMGVAVPIVGVVAPIVVAVYLYRAAGRAQA